MRGQLLLLVAALVSESSTESLGLSSEMILLVFLKVFYFLKGTVIPSTCTDDMSCIWIERLNLRVGQDTVKAHCEGAQGEFCRLWRGRGRVTCLLRSGNLLTGNHWFGRHIKLFWFIYCVSELHIFRAGDHNSFQFHVC